MIAILKGTLVQGSIEGTDNSILRVNQEIDPPAYQAPLDDFELKAAEGSRKSRHLESSRHPTPRQLLTAGA
jgi:hypothetical protein